MAIECVEMLITPELARTWIEATGEENYRKPDDRRVAALVNDLKGGRWQLNGETIKRSGEIVTDGLHRLTAIVRSGVSARTLVVTGVASETMLSVDRGRPRTFGQELAYRKVSRPSEAASVTHNLRLLRAGQWGERHGGKDTSDLVELAFYEEHERAIQDGLRMVWGAKRGAAARAFVNSGLLVPVIVEGTQKFKVPSSSEDARAFVDVLSTGETGVAHGCPALALRNRFILERTRRKRSETEIRRALVIHAWNLFVDGQPVGERGLAYRLVGPRASAFPTVRPAQK
jgi:hypothetical protein